VAPAEAQTAGFTTLVFCQDFTQQIPNSAGGAINPGGTSTNWLGCVTGDSGPGQRLFWMEGNAAPCQRPARVQQVIDPTTGQLTMDFAMPASEIGQGGGNLNTIRMDNNPHNDTNIGTYYPFPMASLIEFTYRDNTASNNTTCADPATADLFTGSHEGGDPTVKTNTLELDILENWTGGVNCDPFQGLGNTVHNWFLYPNQEAAASWHNNYGNMPPGMNENPHWFDNYHTYGSLTTTDGRDMYHCGYIDHVLVGCYQTPGLTAGHLCNQPPGTNNQSACYGQRSELWWWWGDQHNPPAFDQHYWVEGWRVWSCPAWNATDPKISNPGVNTCYGTVITH
jgi:hypothetical protein